MYRIWVGLWEERPGQPGDEPDWWQSSVRTTTGWRHHAVPFERLYPADTNVDRELDLQRIVGLVFYLDPTTDDPIREGSPGRRAADGGPRPGIDPPAELSLLSAQAPPYL